MQSYPNELNQVSRNPFLYPNVDVCTYVANKMFKHIIIKISSKQCITVSNMYYVICPLLGKLGYLSFIVAPTFRLFITRASRGAVSITAQYFRYRNLKNLADRFVKKMEKTECFFFTP